MSRDVDYLSHRPLIVRLAYDITGSWTDAEDVAQQAWVRWQAVTGEVGQPRAYLARVATTLALDVVAARDKVGYPGPFLPEPVLTGPGADEAVEHASEVEIALMVVLGTLSPLERAAFLLHDVFAFTHEEIAAMLGRRPAAVRQLASRARRRVQERPAEEPAVGGDDLKEMTQRFLAAARAGEVDQLRSFLTDDVVFVGDGGGKVPSVLRPVTGSDRVARFLVGVSARLGADVRFEVVHANQRPALAVHDGTTLDQILWLVLSEGRIRDIYSVRNPDKLTEVAAAVR